MASKKDRIYMPMGIGGLMRYPEEEKEVLKLKPKHVVWIVSFCVVAELLLRFWG